SRHLQYIHLLVSDSRGFVLGGQVVDIHLGRAGRLKSRPLASSGTCRALISCRAYSACLKENLPTLLAMKARIRSSTYTIRRRPARRMCARIWAQPYGPLRDEAMRRRMVAYVERL